MTIAWRSVTTTCWGSIYVQFVKVQIILYKFIGWTSWFQPPLLSSLEFSFKFTLHCTYRVFTVKVNTSLSVNPKKTVVTRWTRRDSLRSHTRCNRCTRYLLVYCVDVTVYYCRFSISIMAIRITCLSPCVSHSSVLRCYPSRFSYSGSARIFRLYFDLMSISFRFLEFVDTTKTFEESWSIVDLALHYDAYF